jgi:DNA topoisomerase-2
MSCHVVQLSILKIITHFISERFSLTIVGSVERVSQPMYVWNGEKIIEKEITYTPGLYKIFDEILVNAADNKQRHENTDKIEISINASENKIQVKNNGTGMTFITLTVLHF